VENLDLGRAGKRPRNLFGPLDRKDSVRRNFLQSEVVNFSGIGEPIQIDVDEGDAATAIFLHDREGRAVHDSWLEPEAFGKAPRKRCFPCSEIAEQQNDVAGIELTREITARRGGVGFRAARYRG
jgi:hypothetical protein